MDADAARHEAGHALATLAVGGRVSGIEIGDDPHTRVLTPSAWGSSPEDLRRHMWISLGGPAAEGRADTSDVDWQRALELGEQLARRDGGGSAVGHVAIEYERVRTHLRKRRYTLDALAAALLARRRLNEDDVRRILTRVRRISVLKTERS